MKRRAVQLHISDHAVLRYLQRRHGLDIEVVRRHLSGLAVNAAQLGAVAVRVEGVRIYLRDAMTGDGRLHVTATEVALPLRKEGDDG